MSLACGCDIDGAPSVFRQKMQKARKQHKCLECKKIIEIGELYEYTFGIWEGDADSFHTCEDCSDLRDSMEAMGFCPTYGELKDEHKEYISEYQPPILKHKANQDNERGVGDEDTI